MLINLFINKKAIDFVLEEIAKKYDKKQRSIVEDRVIFLNENENILVINDNLKKTINDNLKKKGSCSSP